MSIIRLTGATEENVDSTQTAEHVRQLSILLTIRRSDRRTREGKQLATSDFKAEWLFRSPVPLPLIEAIRRNQAAPILKWITEGRFRGGGFRSGVDRTRSD